MSQTAHVLSVSGSAMKTQTKMSGRKRVILLSLIPIVILISSCGTIKSKEYTDLALRNAVLEARAEAAQDRRDVFQLLFEQWQQSEGRRAHMPRPGVN